MRLIDADALKKEVENFQNCYNGWSDTYDKAYIIEAIEAIPSVDIPHSDDWEKYSDKLWKNAYERGKADRPQGKWIRTGRTNIYGGIEVQCSNCGDRVMVQHLEDEWYCRHCGADMGMKGADDE